MVMLLTTFRMPAWTQKWMEHYKELLQQWKRDEDSMQDQLNEIEGDVKYVRKKIDDLTEIVSPKKEVIVEG